MYASPKKTLRNKNKHNPKRSFFLRSSAASDLADKGIFFIYHDVIACSLNGCS